MRAVGNDWEHMYGAFSGMSFGVVALVALMVIALSVLASPLIAVIIALMGVFFVLFGMSATRQRSARRGQTRRRTPASGEG
jgi:phosphate/sulfate permease